MLCLGVTLNFNLESCIDDHAFEFINVNVQGSYISIGVLVNKLITFGSMGLCPIIKSEFIESSWVLIRFIKVSLLPLYIKSL